VGDLVNRIHKDFLFSMNTLFNINADSDKNLEFNGSVEKTDSVVKRNIEPCSATIVAVEKQ
jgi:hypothetical protein